MADKKSIKNKIINITFYLLQYPAWVIGNTLIPIYEWLKR